MKWLVIVFKSLYFPINLQLRVRHVLLLPTSFVPVFRRFLPANVFTAKRLLKVGERDYGQQELDH